MQSAANTLYRSPRDTTARGPPLPAVTSPAVPQVPTRPPPTLPSVLPSSRCLTPALLLYLPLLLHSFLLSRLSRSRLVVVPIFLLALHSIFIPTPLSFHLSFPPALILSAPFSLGNDSSCVASFPPSVGCHSSYFPPVTSLLSLFLSFSAPPSRIPLIPILSPAPFPPGNDSLSRSPSQFSSLPFPLPPSSRESPHSLPSNLLVTSFTFGSLPDLCSLSFRFLFLFLPLSLSLSLYSPCYLILSLYQCSLLSYLLPSLPPVIPSLHSLC